MFKVSLDFLQKLWVIVATMYFILSALLARVSCTFSLFLLFNPFTHQGFQVGTHKEKGSPG